jgi:hypothetical protein
MMAANAIALTLGTIATIAIADDRAVARGMQDLLDHGFEVVAEGQLVGAVECTSQFAPVTIEQIRQRSAERCFTGKVAYGSFKRLKGENSEFVCVSFQDWACYQSQNSN